MYRKDGRSLPYGVREGASVGEREDEGTPDGTATSSATGDSASGANGEGPATGAAEQSPTERRLALLWNPPAPAQRGRPPRFTLDDVVNAGIAVAKDAGLDAVSMRNVARHLGTGAMSLYTYVPSKTELVDLMIDRAYGEMSLPEPGLPWRVALERHAREHYAMYQRHPWLLQANPGRLPLAPHVLDAMEAGYRTLIDTSLSEAHVVEMLGLVDAFVQGQARLTVTEARDEAITGVSYGDYWRSLEAFWERYFDVERYPTMTRIWNAGGFDTTETPFDASLARLLDSIAATIAIAN
jgi:AcrR family transcriptional regulator